MDRVHKDEMAIMGIAVRTTNEGGQAMQDIGALWERFYGENVTEQIPGKLSKLVYGLYTDYESDHTKPYTLLVGCEVQIGSAPPEGLEVREVPASTYAHLACRGEHPQALIDGWVKVWESDLNRRFSGDLEVYAGDFPQDAPNVDLLIALKD